ncbi:MAG: glycosyltransferase family 39 protein [Candidatus Aenigmarchaeota archaeon]|nr:glycosyltransferase family 39 protein [Candidatus Aenigmarchaeota archaeon]
MSFDVIFLKEKAIFYRHYIGLFAVFAVALWLRMMPFSYDYLQGIDPYYIFRMMEHLVENNLHLPALDTMRYYPDGFAPHIEHVLMYYPYAVFYMIVSKFAAIDALAFAKFAPAFFGALFTIPMFFIGKELHTKTTGLFAAFFFAVSPSVIFRTSAGFIEKEPFGGLFLITAIWFFLRAIRKDSLVSGLVSGMSLALGAATWGGVNALYLALAGYTVIMVLTTRHPEPYLKAFAPVVLLGVLIPAYTITLNSFTGTYQLVLYSALGLVLFVELMEKYTQYKKEHRHYTIPALFGFGAVFVLVGSFFSAALARLVSSAWGMIFFKESVIMSTVAESVTSTWPDFTRGLSTAYAAGALPFMSGVLPVFSIWVFAFFGIFLMINEIFKKKNTLYFVLILMAFVNLVSYFKFLTNAASGITANQALLQVIFVFTLVPIVYFVGRKNYKYAFILFLFYSSLLGFLSRVRILFIVGPYAFLLAGYAVTKIIHAVKYSKIMQEAKDLSGKVNIYSVGAGIFVLLLIVSNFSAGYVISSNLRPSFGGAWVPAMDFLKTNTTEDAVILSWWDFGYWFQTMGERATLLDGGNYYGALDEYAARYFTGYYNETEQEDYLLKWRPTHILVDSTMIGKYAAMSKIANEGKKVESYMEMGKTGTYPQGNASVIVYSAYSYQIWIPVTQEGALGGNIVLSAGPNQAYIKYLCTENGLVDLNPPEDKPATDSCVFITPNTILLASKDIGESPFTKLFLQEGVGLDYVTEVYNNGAIKIFEVDYELLESRN